MNETRIAGDEEWLGWIPSGGDGSDDSGNDDGDSVDDDSTGDDSTDDDVPDEDEDEPQDTKAALKKLQQDYARLKGHLQNADRNKSKAQKELDELKRKERTDLENAQADLAKEVEARTQWETRFRGLAVTNAFLTESQRAGVVWHDPEVAQSAAALKDLEIDEDGVVAGMADAVKKLAKEKPFLVNGGDQEEKERKPKTGSPVGSGGSKGKPANGKLTKEELMAKFPALRR